MPQLFFITPDGEKHAVEGKVGDTVMDAGIIRKVTFVDSHRDQLIQLADMVAGAIRAAHDSPRNDAKEYLLALGPRMRDERSDIWLASRPR